MADSRPFATRVVLNFSHRCALNCEWCYVSFGVPTAQKKIVSNIVDRIASLNFEVITFGGGDPFQYSYIAEIVERAKAEGLYVHIDTHGKALAQSQKNARLIKNNVDLLGLPLDGPTSEVHDTMRRAPGHFDLLMKRFEWLGCIGAQFKINTIVTRSNVDFLLELAIRVRDLKPSRWSIYQYMPLGPGARVSSVHELEADEFQLAIDLVKERLWRESEFLIEVAEKDSRRSTYPIIQHDGSVFVHSQDEPSYLRHICSIFDRQAREKINEVCGPERAAAMSRYFKVL